MPAMKHVHTYVRWRVTQSPSRMKIDKLIKGERAFKCAHPECSHYAQLSLVEGKMSSCNKCHTEFVLDTKAMALVKPLCINCRQDAEALEYQRLQKEMVNIIDDIFAGDPGMKDSHV